ncbi:uncharacterized protein LOC108665801 [Hyalella azteca]|uniref:Uncharacterized protein LOC108665801 n=1 Tax=Hyalella azteca TaxID=294128 RepID=A0A979FG38_HYAAZ|nr:uncharacterized protein LOC108665801 [Hyalella azteca]
MCRSMDATELYHSTQDLSASEDSSGGGMTTSVLVPGASARRRTRTATQDLTRSPPTPPSPAAEDAPQGPSKGPPRRRGRSETARPRPKSMINTGEVRAAYMSAGEAGRRPRLHTLSGGRPAAIVAKPAALDIPATGEYRFI